MKSLYAQWLLNSHGVPSLYLVDFDLPSFLFHIRQNQMNGKSIMPIIINPNSEVEPIFKSKAFWDGLERKLIQTGAKVVVFDTLLDFIDGDYSRAGDLNLSMQRCRNFAVKTDVAIILITHTVKVSWNRENLTLSDVADSRVVTTKSDLVFGFQVNQDISKRTLLRVEMLKNRLGPQLDPPVYRVETPRTHPSGIFDFALTNEEIPAMESPGASAAVQRAIVDLRNLIETQGGKCLVSEAGEYMKHLGHSTKIIRKAKELICTHEKVDNRWFWKLKDGQ